MIAPILLFLSKTWFELIVIIGCRYYQNWTKWYFNMMLSGLYFSCAHITSIWLQIGILLMTSVIKCCWWLLSTSLLTLFGSHAATRCTCKACCMQYNEFIEALWIAQVACDNCGWDIYVSWLAPWLNQWQLEKVLISACWISLPELFQAYSKHQSEEAWSIP